MSPRKNRPVAVAIVLVTLALTALFFAQGAMGLIASTFLALDTTTPVAAAPRTPGRGRATVERKDPCPILERNIFDSETGDLCHVTVATEESDEITETEELDPNAPLPHCEGSVRLVGALVNTRNREWSFAAITGASGKALLYREGMTVDGRLVVAIGSSNVVMRPETGSHCQLAMFDPEAPEAGSVRPTARVSRANMEGEESERPTRPTREGAIPASEIESGITRNSDTNFTVSRGLVDQLLTNQAELMRTARIIPHEENGRTVGVKLYGIRRNSLLGRLGLQNGDMLRTINGYDMSSPDSALEAYSNLRGANNLSVNVVRRGNPMSLEYNIQ